MASFPNSVKTFTTRNLGDTIQASHINDLQDEVNAIEAGYLNGTARLNSSASTMASLHVTGFSTIGALIAGALDVTTGSTLHGTLDVTSSATFTSNVTVGGTFNASGQSQLRGSIVYSASTNVTPASTGNTNDLAISATVSQVRLNITGNSTITGLAMAGGALDGQTLMFWNVGSGTCNLPHQTGSASTGQWICPQNTAVSLKTNGGLLARYDGTSSGWRIMLAS